MTSNEALTSTSKDWPDNFPAPWFQNGSWGLTALVIDPVTEPVGFSRDGLATARIEHPVPTSPCSGVLVVSDDGPGIADQDRDRIFDRFTRIDEARSSKTGGAGLGLAIARDIATGHGGLTPPGGHRKIGATFELAIPLPPPDIASSP